MSKDSTSTDSEESLKTSCFVGIASVFETMYGKETGVLNL